MPDAVIQEIRRIKEANASKHGRNISAMIKDLRKRQGDSGRKVVTLAPRRPSGQGKIGGKPMPREVVR